MCSFVSPSFFKIAGHQFQPHWVLRQHRLKGVCSGSRVSVCSDTKPVAMPPCPPQWCTVPQACWASSKPLSGGSGPGSGLLTGPGCPLLPRKPRGKQRWDFGRRRALGWIFLQGPLHPEAGCLPRPAELWRFLSQLKVWEHLCFPGGIEKGPKPNIACPGVEKAAGGGMGKLGKQLLKTN